MPWDIALIFLVLGVVVPWRGRVRLRQLMARPRVESAERVSLYASTIVFQWLAVVVAGWRARAHGFSSRELGLAVSGGATLAIIAVAGALFIAALQWFNLRRMGRSTSPHRGKLQALAERILPQSRSELAVFSALAVTAGLCEEFLYRGFAMAVFLRWGLPVWIAASASALLFGLAHLYQGKSGLVGTTILGLLFGFVRAVTGSLVPVILWHAGVDLVAGVAGPKYLINNGDKVEVAS
jgi:membrane protease YdiL (CAAX protease family)